MSAYAIPTKRGQKYQPLADKVLAGREEIQRIAAPLVVQDFVVAGGRAMFHLRVPGGRFKKEISTPIARQDNPAVILAALLQKVRAYRRQVVVE